jgi:hypothetical protein
LNLSADEVEPSGDSGLKDGDVSPPLPGLLAEALHPLLPGWLLLELNTHAIRDDEHLFALSQEPAELMALKFVTIEAVWEAMLTQFSVTIRTPGDL